MFKQLSSEDYLKVLNTTCITPLYGMKPKKSKKYSISIDKLQQTYNFISNLLNRKKKSQIKIKN